MLGVLTYTGARMGALARLRRGDLQNQETQRVLRFLEKGGKQREIPVRHDLDEWIAAYLEAGCIDLSPKAAPRTPCAVMARSASPNPHLSAAKNTPHNFRVTGGHRSRLPGLVRGSEHSASSRAMKPRSASAGNANRR